jgi:hypothetical protein
MTNVTRNRRLDSMLESDAKADLLVLFNNHPSSREEQIRLAKRIGRRSEEIDGDLKDLTDLSFLSERFVSNREVVCYDEKRASNIRRIISSQIPTSLEAD